MRLTDFHERMELEFGRIRGDSILVDHVLLALGGRSGAAAIEDGVDPRDVWHAICAERRTPIVEHVFPYAGDRPR